MDVEKKIKEWLDSPQDYSEGIELLKMVSKKSKLIGRLMKVESKVKKEKLAYELAHFLGLKEVPKPVEKPVKNAGKKTGTKTPKKTEKTGPKESKFEARPGLIGKEESIEDYPAEIKDVINEYSSLYMERGKDHAALKEVGEANDADSISKRKELIEKMRVSSLRMEALHKVFETYKSYKTVDLSLLEEKKGDATTKEVTVESLKKEKKNLQASLVKDRNLLKYQTKNKPEDGKPKPMPEGTKKKKIEKRISIKEAQISEIDDKIVKLT